MKIKNKLLLLTFTSLLLASCASNKADDPLIVPPNFNEMPDLNNKDTKADKPADQDVQELKELLLKKQ
jgi:hypothetical protein